MNDEKIMNEPEKEIRLPDFNAANQAMIFQMIRDDQLYFEWLKIKNRIKKQKETK